MKRIICALICFVLLFSFAGCKGESNAANGGVDIAYFADSGSIPESELKLGDAVPETGEENSEYFISGSGGDKYFSNGDFSYYYDPNEKEPVITAIAAFSNVYGFETGAISIEITDLLDAQGILYNERDPKKGELFFLPASGKFSVIECKELKRSLIFVFEDNALCAALLK